MNEKLKERLDSMSVEEMQYHLYAFTRPVGARVLWKIMDSIEKGVDVVKEYGLWAGTTGILLPSNNLKRLIYVPRSVIDWDIEKKLIGKEGITILSQDAANTTGYRNLSEEERSRQKRVLYKLSVKETLESLIKDSSFRFDARKFIQLLISKSKEYNARVRLESEDDIMKGKMIKVANLSDKLLEMYASEMGFDLSSSN